MVLNQQRRRSRSLQPTSRREGKVASNPISASSGARKSNNPSASSKRSAPNRKGSGDVVVVSDNVVRSPLKRTLSFGSTSSSKVSNGKSTGSNGKTKRSPQNIKNANTTGEISFVPPNPADGASTTSGSEEQEVDFFSNPTILSRLIQNQKFASAIARLEKQGPSEASIWVCTKRKLPPALQFGDASRNNNPSSPKSVDRGRGRGMKPRKNIGSNSSDDGSQFSDDNSSNSSFTFRQLPIHMACGSLFRVEAAQGSQLRQDLEQLIARLVIAYPEGCARRDHQGRYPLHECIWYNAAPPIVSALLMAAPDVARVPDQQGVTPAILNEHRQCPNNSHKKMVRGMLKKSPEFWRTARKEAELRMKHREIPGSDVTITSTSVLASSVTGDETIESRGRQPRSVTRNKSGDASDSVQQQQRSLAQSEAQVKQLQQQQQEQQREQQERRQLLQEVRQQHAEPHAPPVKPTEWVQLETRAAALESKLSESYEHIYVLNQQLNELKGAKNALQIKVDKFTKSDLGQRVVALEHERDELQFHLARSQALLAKNGISLEEENAAEGMPPLPPLHITFNASASSVPASTGLEETTASSRSDELVAAQKQNRQALLQEQEQLQMLNQDQMEYQGRIQYFCEINHADDQTAKSEITTDDFTAMTPASKFQPMRPEPDANASLIDTGFMASAVVTEQELRAHAAGSNNSRGSSSRGRGRERNRVSAMSPKPVHPAARNAPPPSMVNRGGPHQPPQQPPPQQAPPRTSGHQPELDSVLMGAMELNGGEGLSPDLVALWRDTSIHGNSTHGSVRGPSPSMGMMQSTYPQGNNNGPPHQHAYGQGHAPPQQQHHAYTQGHGPPPNTYGGPVGDMPRGAMTTPSPMEEKMAEEYAQMMMQTRLLGGRPGTDDSSLPPPIQQQGRPGADDSSLVSPTQRAPNRGAPRSSQPSPGKPRLESVSVRVQSKGPLSSRNLHTPMIS